MADNQDIVYVSTDENGNIRIEPDAHIGPESIDSVTFTFQQGIDITESVQKKNVNNKVPVSFTKKGRSAYSPVSVTYPDGSTSSKFLLENCIVQYTKALDAQNYKYAREFVNIGIPAIYINKIIEDAKKHSQLNLANKPSVQLMSDHYWLRCNLDKLEQGGLQIVTEKGPIKVPVDRCLKNFNQNIYANIMFSLSGSLNNNNLDEELDLRDGTYLITAKPTEIFALDVNDIKGPELNDTNNRAKEMSSMSESFIATGKLAKFAAAQIKSAGR